MLKFVVLALSLCSALSVSLSPTPSQSVSRISLPPACDPAFQPFDLHATSGVIFVGWKDGERDLGAAESTGDDVAEGGGDEANDDETFIASSSSSPTPPVSHTRTSSPSRGSLPSKSSTTSHSSTPAPSKHRSQLPPGITCQWVIEGGAGMVVDLTWEWARGGGSPTVAASSGDGTAPCVSSGAYLGILTKSSGAGSPPTVLDSLCYYNPLPFSKPRVVHSNASSVMVDLILDDAPTAGTLSPPPSPITGFSLSYRVYDPSIPNVDCKLSPWGEWGPCSVTCGGGNKVRERHVVTPASGTGTCRESDLTDYYPCGGVSCAPAPDVPCSLSPWSDWGPGVVNPPTLGDPKGGGGGSTTPPPVAQGHALVLRVYSPLLQVGELPVPVNPVL